MMFIDVGGASGATYRFRLWGRDEERPPMAANYVVVRHADEPEIVTVGVTEHLGNLDAEALRAASSCQVYTRLNVSRQVRMAEHEDIVALHDRATIVE